MAIVFVYNYVTCYYSLTTVQKSKFLQLSKFAEILPKMGPKRRNKFERIYSESEADSSDEESSPLNNKTSQNVSLSEEGKLDNENVNNSNSVETESSSKGINHDGNDKFLITRSKRKYDKPNIRLSLKRISEMDEQNVQNNGKESEPEPKRKRETIKSLDSKINDANNFLQQLSKKLEDREQEINNLKQVISKDRKNKSELESLLGSTAHRDNLNYHPVTFHDFPISGEIESEEDEEFNIDPIFEERESRKRSRSRSRSTDKRKKRKNSRSRSGGRREERRHRSDDKKLSNRTNSQDDSKTDEASKETRYREDPIVQQMVKKMVQEQVHEQVRQEMERRNKLENVSGMEINSVNNLVGKSPSDTLIYTPAVNLNRDHLLNGSPQTGNRIGQNLDYTMSSIRNDHDHNTQEKQRQLHNSTLNSEMINDTLSKLRLLSDRKMGELSVKEPTSAATATATAGNRHQHDQIRDARNAADNAILEAERFKARIQQPNRGMEFYNSPKCKHDELRAMRYLENDDDEFFHTTCHIDEILKEKIEKGKFVELDKLLQKGILHNKEESRMQLINKNGSTYFVPTIDRDCKIDGIKKWEQAFRAYTTIYCKANPHRSGEILQYIDIIHRAAAIFNWDNVAKYDYVFRQLMAAKPHRSWAKVYTQMWNITLNEPIKKFNENGNYSQNNSQRSNNGKRKDNFCWKYNKNSCSYGKTCKFDHKCSYCGVAGHPVTNCHKKQGKKGGDKAKSSSSSSSN